MVVISRSYHSRSAGEGFNNQLDGHHGILTTRNVSDLGRLPKQINVPSPPRPMHLYPD
jgi:hypothetical protein